jgi:hypothetical protein
MRSCRRRRFDPASNLNRTLRDDAYVDARAAGIRFDPRARAGRDAPAIVPSRPPNCFDPRARAGRDKMPRTRNGAPAVLLQSFGVGCE